MAKLLKIEKDVEAIIKSKPVGLYKVEQKRKWIYLWIRGRKTPILIKNEGKNKEAIDKGDYKYFLDLLISLFKKGDVTKEDEKYIEAFEKAKAEIERQHGGVSLVEVGETERYRASQNVGKAKEILKKKSRINKSDIEDYALDILEEELHMEQQAEKMKKERIREIKRKIKEIDSYLNKHKDLIKRTIKGYKPKKGSRDYKILEKVVEKGTLKKQLLEELKMLERK
ncbi:MAG: hypothetical protein JG759_408 [Thermoanaerobacter sp.]|jgi:hypothetical protein|nr:hypothetical protein [Thermoanaerobacter sp.]